LNPTTPSRDFLWLNLRELPYFRALVRAVEAEFYQKYELPGPTLDIGCGDGHFADITFSRHLEIGLDPSGSSLNLAKNRHFYGLLTEAFGNQMPFASNSFGSAVSNSVLEHIPHIQEVLNETGRVLKPGGLFLFCVPNPAYLGKLGISNGLARIGLNNLGRAYKVWFRRMSRVEHLEWPDVWQGWLEQAGFKLEQWWHYFSPAAMRTLEYGHYLGSPTLLARALTGRWILAPYKWNLGLTEAAVRSYARAEADPNGVFTYYVARKRV
jgi:SAM-dependent methyltransferase